MSNRSVPGMATSGRPVIGLGTVTTITGYPAPGSKLPRSASFGPPDTGAGAAAHFSSMKDIGGRTLDIMAGSITESATVVTATKAAGGKTIISTTTPR